MDRRRVCAGLAAAMAGACARPPAPEPPPPEPLAPGRWLLRRTGARRGRVEAALRRDAAALALAEGATHVVVEIVRAEAEVLYPAAEPGAVGRAAGPAGRSPADAVFRAGGPRPVARVTLEAEAALAGPQTPGALDARAVLEGG